MGKMSQIDGLMRYDGFTYEEAVKRVKKQSGGL